MHKFPKPKIHASIVILGWIIAIGGGLVTLYGRGIQLLDNVTWKRADFVAYETLYRPAWAVCICWVIWACHHGYGGFINYILSMPFFLPLSKLSYGVYMIHWAVVTFDFYTARYKREISIKSIVR